MRIGKFELILLVGIAITVIIFLYLLIFGDLEVTQFISLLSIIIATLALFYSKASFGSKISILKEEIDGTFFPQYGEAAITKRDPVLSTTYEKNAFIGGRLRMSLIFYNEGDQMSVVTVKKAELPDLNFESIRIDDCFSIQAHSHQEYKFNDAYFISKDHTLPSSIDSLRVKYTWTKKGQIMVSTIEIPINCEIYSPK